MAIPTITNNSPSAGYISWGGFTIQLYGVAYSVPAASSNQRWVWWEYKNGVPIINSGPDVPSTLVDDDLVLFANKNGIGVRVQSTNFVDGELLVDGSIFADALSTNLINSQHIVTSGLDAGVIKFGTMSGDRIAANTITGEHIVAGTVSGDVIIANTLGGDKIIANSLDADRIIANTITAAQLASVLVVGNTITTRAVDPNTGAPYGPGVDLTPSGMTLYDGAGKPLVEMPNQGKAIWRGEAYISALTVETLTTLQQTLLAQASVFTMATGVSDPTNAVSIQTSFVTEAYTAVANTTWTSRYGWSHDGKSHAFTLRKNSGTDGSFAFERWGTQSGSRTRVNNYGFDYFCEDAQLGNVFNVATDSSCDIAVVYRPKGNGTNNWYAAIWHWNATTGDFVINAASETNLIGMNTDYLPAVVYDTAANKFRAVYSDKAQAEKLSFLSWTQGNTTPDPKVLTSLVFPYHLASLLYGAFDLGATRYIVASRSETGGSAYRIFDTAGTEQVGDEWTRYLPNATCNGLTWNPATSSFLAFSEGIVQNYEAGGNTWSAAADATWYAAYSWSNGTVETKLSPPQAFTMKERARLTLTAPNRPASVSEARFYLWKGATAPSVGAVSMVRQGVSTATPPQLVVSNANFGTKNNVVANGFGAGTPAEVRSQATSAGVPLISLKGDGSGRVGPWQWDSAGVATAQPATSIDPRLLRRGSVSGTASASSITLAVSFGATPMAAVPSVTASPSAGTQMYVASITSKSVNGFSVIMVQRDNAAVNAAVGCDWIAAAF